MLFAVPVRDLGIAVLATVFASNSSYESPQAYAVYVDERTVDAEPGEEFVIPAEQAHRIRCTGSEPGRILEVAYGYTTEDDTQRLEDAYGRPLEPDW